MANRKPKKILLINEGFSSNLGDQAIRESMTEALQFLGNEVDFAYFSNPALQSLPAYDYGKQKPAATAKPVKMPFQGLRAYVNNTRWYWKNKKRIADIVRSKNYDVVIIGGGQLLNSSARLRFNVFSLALFTWVSAVRRYTRAKIYLIGVGVPSRFQKAEQFFYGKAMQKIDRTWVRDNTSRKSLLANFNVQSELMPDVAFFDRSGDHEKYEKADLALVGIYNYNEFNLKFNARGLDKARFYEEWTGEVRRLIAEGMQVKLFYTTQADARESHLFADYLQNTQDITAEILDTPDLRSLGGWLKKARKVYSGRMHALILGMKYGCIAEPYLLCEKLETFDNEYIRRQQDPATYSGQVLEVMETAVFGEKTVPALP